MQYSRVVSFGDSFTYGNDLSDWQEEEIGIPGRPSYLTWPALLAKYLNLDYKCCASPGASNSTILRTILSTDIKKTDLVIANWTWINRWDFYNGNAWSTLRPSGTEDNPFYEHYYRYFQSELWDKFETLKNIQVAFSKFNNKFISTAIDPLTIDKQWHCPEYVNNLINSIDTKLTWFDGKGFYQWAKDRDYPISDKWHPLEQAHQAAFEYIKDNCDFT
jgi:hypothetical protein